ncbi:molybdopterin-binding protein [Caulobacter sp. 17J65-9]|uniref:competence/damage-inducible protein A n=1 Tax=Caulobacter sp. 17J65-9 TaxID=2709382 RepID=UPI0013CCC251|nr:molybdopterin-binding protein [Caulobacter sp. 17J65-9]NEX91427.1 competence/damage-inducible protein A [Caulobacter sp. 17J65-9]
MSDQPSAAVLIIGDEILSGRTQDTNLNVIARFLADLGVDLQEARTVGDGHDRIVEALDALRARYDYVITTGGIGPTHDDVTAEAVAAAFGVDLPFHPEALAILERRYDGDFNAARRRMARIPQGATLIRNPVSDAPGFQIDNVFVLAGVPQIMTAMLDDVRPRMRTGRVKVERAAVVSGAGEGLLAAPLEAAARARPDLSFGSYPRFAEGGWGVKLVVGGRDVAAVDAATRELLDLLREAGVPKAEVVDA